MASEAVESNTTLCEGGAGSCRTPSTLEFGSWLAIWARTEVSRSSTERFFSRPPVELVNGSHKLANRAAFAAKGRR